MGRAQFAARARASFGKHEPPRAWPGVQKLCSRSGCRAPCRGPRPEYRRPAPSAQIGDLIDERDLGGEEGIRCVFDELGAAAAGVKNGSTVEVKRAIDFIDHFAGTLVMHADNDPVGVFEILDGCSFAQEFRVGNDGDIGVRPCRMRRATSSPVPTGTVDLVMTTVNPLTAEAISRAAA